jgi:hypothetical protein
MFLRWRHPSLRDLWFLSKQLAQKTPGAPIMNQTVLVLHADRESLDENAPCTLTARLPTERRIGFDLDDSVIEV